MPQYRRVLLKLSGEVLGGEKGAGLDFEAVRHFSSELKELHRAGIELALVVGGGNMLRGRDAQDSGLERAQADYIGMLGTVMNALALQGVLEQQGVPARVQSAIAMTPVAEPYVRGRALHHLQKGRVVIFAAGTGHPFFSTDTTAALRSAEMGVDCLVKGTKVNGIYDKDPRANKDAVFFPSLSYTEALQRNLQVMDTAAFALCRESKIPILVLNVQDGNKNLERALIRGEPLGTIVKE